MKEPPWMKSRTSMPTARTLRRWREIAQKLAKSIGAVAACDLCKRPVAYSFGVLWLRTPNQWRVKAKKRRICHACYEHMSEYIAELETNGAMWNLPPEEYNGAMELEESEKLFHGPKRYARRKAAESAAQNGDEGEILPTRSE
jgi:hypothetical protein